MASQTLIFVMLPNGVESDKRQRCSVYLTPRLDAGTTLADFPDFINWPKTVLQNGLKFQITCGAKKATVTPDISWLMPDEWARVFTSQTPVSPYTLPAYDKQLFVSYPVRDSLAFLKYLYQYIGVQGAPTGDRRPYFGLLNSLAFGQNGNPPLEDVLQQVRSELWTAQLAALDPVGGVSVLTANAGIPPISPPDGVPASTSAPTNYQAALSQFCLFHHMPPAPNRPPLPSTPAEFSKLLDFHSALTALSSYPALMRAFGLVFDLDLPAGFCPASPAGGAYGTVAVSGLAPGFKWKIAPTLSFPATAYVASATSFGAAPATAPATLATNPYPANDVIGGFLSLSAVAFQLVQVDIDGALLKTLSLANNVENTNGDSSVIDGTLPAMRTSGIALVANGRGLQLLQSIVNNQSFNQALTGGAYPRPFNATDLVRGYRLDVWTSRSGKWYSLHRRNSVYQLGPSNSLQTLTATDEEGFLQTAAAQPADDPTRTPDPPSSNHVPSSATDIFVHERLASWNGWSLSAPRPGLALNRSVDPGQALDADPTMNEPVTSFKVTTSFQAVAGSLPELRFGDQYRIRARTVDLAGNSVELSAVAPDAVVQPPNAVDFPYLRFEPVSPPLVVVQQTPSAGSGLERLVIRSRNSQPSLDSMVSPYSDSRHIAPPRIAVRMAELHGLLDDAKGHLKGDANTFKLIVTTDQYTIPLVDGFPLDASQTFDVGYLPDPIARGAAFAGLPNTPDDTSGALIKNQLSYVPLTDVQPRPGSVTFIDFGNAWPDREAFLLTLVEGDSVPSWDASNRILTVFLSKAGDIDVDLSSYLFEQDLGIMAVWEWLREYFDALELQAIQDPSASSEVPGVSDQIALFTRLILEGGHPMITPSRTLNLVHAVQQPLGQPSFQQLPVVHNTTDPIFASVLRNSFTPITAWRTLGSHNAVLLGALDINGASTSKIDIESQAYEVTDDPTKPAPTKGWQSQHVETINIASLTGEVIYADSSQTRMVGTYIPQVDALWFSAPFDILGGVATPSDVAAPIHRFDDTKHRWVSYTAVGTTRFQEFFPEPGLVFTRESEPLIVDVPSSGRPLAPEIVYVVPTFGWENQERSNVKSSVRFGNGLRVYLDRPWYSSGDDELLGVVLWSGAAGAPDVAQRESYKGWFTQWGADPIWLSGTLNPVPGISDFAEPAATAQGLTIEETTAIQVDVAGHQVLFDQSRNLWYCDIEFNQTASYAPFVRLALARYQAHSITGVELSRIVLADFAQLTPNRSAVLIIDPSSPQNARLYVGGLAPQGPLQTTITVSVETRWANVESDAGWVPSSPADVMVTSLNPGAEPGAVLWAGTITFKQPPSPDRFRVVVLEYERIPVDETGPPNLLRLPGSRVVYAVTIPYNYP